MAHLPSGLPRLRAAASVCTLALIALSACSSGDDASGAANAGGSDGPPVVVDAPASKLDALVAPGTDGASATCGAFPTDYTSGNGSVTYYTFSMGSSAVNCSYDIGSTNPDTVAGSRPATTPTSAR